MADKIKNWLVRTKDLDILGPFTERELKEALRKALFRTEDEICPSFGAWISAQTLLNHDIDEVTRTSTRHQTSTLNLNATNELTLTPTPTPTPTSTNPPAPPLAIEGNTARKLDPRETLAEQKPRLAPLLTGAFLVVTLLILLQLKSKSSLTNDNLVLNRVTTGETPFIQTVYDLISRNRRNEAMRMLTDYHQKNPTEIEHLVPYAALIVTEQESPLRAKKHLETVLNSDAPNAIKAKAHLWMGYALLSEEEGDMGENHFLEALQFNPKDPVARFNLGRSYLKQEKYTQALEYLQFAELEAPDLWLIHIYIGRAKFMLGKMDDARASFRLAIETAPDRWLSYIYYSLFLVGIKDYNEARLTIRKMLTRDPEFELASPPPFGYFQERVGYNEYLSAFTQVMQQASAEEKELGRLYIAYLMNGAQGSEGKKLESLGERGGLLARVVGLKGTLSQTPTAEDLRKGLARLPNNLSEFGAYAYVVRGDAKMRLGMTAEAQQDFQLALLSEPKSASGHWALYSLYKNLGQNEEAMKEIKTILSYHPNYIPAINAALEH